MDGKNNGDGCLAILLGLVVFCLLSSKLEDHSKRIDALETRAAVLEVRVSVLEGQKAGPTPAGKDGRRGDD